MLYMKPRFRPMGDRALLVEAGDAIHPEVNRKVREMFLTLSQDPIPGIIDRIPAYRSLLIVYDPLVVSGERLEDMLSEIYLTGGRHEIPPPGRLKSP